MSLYHKLEPILCPASLECATQPVQTGGSAKISLGLPRRRRKQHSKHQQGLLEIFSRFSNHLLRAEDFRRALLAFSYRPLGPDSGVIWYSVGQRCHPGSCSGFTGIDLEIGSPETTHFFP